MPAFIPHYPFKAERQAGSSYFLVFWSDSTKESIPDTATTWQTL